MKTLVVTTALALSSTLALAAGDAKPNTAGSSDGSPAIGKPADTGAGDTYLASQHWKKYSNGGYMSKSDAMLFKGADGKSVDWQRLDADNDGKVSEREWATYHQTAGAAGLGSGAGTAKSAASAAKATN